MEVVQDILPSSRREGIRRRRRLPTMDSCRRHPRRDPEMVVNDLTRPPDSLNELIHRPWLILVPGNCVFFGKERSTAGKLTDKHIS